MNALEQAPNATKPYRLVAWQRITVALLGLASAACGAVATFVSSNGAGTAGLLLIGALLVIVGVLGVAPVRLKVGDNEVELSPAGFAEFRELGVSSRPAGAEALRDLAIKYEALRGALPPGGRRTVLLESLMVQARALADLTAPEEVLGRLQRFDTDGEGARVVTLALLQASPTGAPLAAEKVQGCIRHPRTKFEQFHGLLAARECFHLLPRPDQAALQAAAGEYLADPAADPSGDRAALARQILQLSPSA